MTASPRSRAARHLAVIGVPLVLLAACGGGESDDATSSVAPVPAETATATDAPPATEAPATVAPTTDAPATEAPASTDTPLTDAPATEAPAENVVPVGLEGAVTLDGSPLDTAALAGRPTVLWFWAPWCTVCRAEAPDVTAVAAELGDQVNLIGVGGQGGNAEMIEFVEQTGTSAITHVSDPNGVVWSEYEIFAQPAFAFVTADGRVETYVGSLGAEGLTDIIGKLLEA